MTLTIELAALVMTPFVVAAGWHFGRCLLYSVALFSLMMAQRSSWWRAFHDEFAKDL